MSRSPSPRRSAWRAAQVITTMSALRDMAEPYAPAARADRAMEPPPASTALGPRREGEGAAPRLLRPIAGADVPNLTVTGQYWRGGAVKGEIVRSMIPI